MGDEVGAIRPERNARLAGWAAKQWGNATREQIRAAGFSDSQVRNLVRADRLLRRHRGVYAVGHRSPAPESRWAAALLAAGPSAALSHAAALALHGLLPPPRVTDVTVPTQRRGDPTLRVHRTPLTAADVQIVRGLRVTTISRALLDVAAACVAIDRLAQQACGARLVHIEDLRAYARAHASDRGGPRLLAAVEQPHTRSKSERRLLAYLKRHGLPLPECNARIGRLHVDAFYPQFGLVVELDHEQTHGTTHAVRDDAWRDRYTANRELETLRIGEDDLALLAAELRRRGGA